MAAGDGFKVCSHQAGDAGAVGNYRETSSGPHRAGMASTVLLQSIKSPKSPATSCFSFKKRVDLGHTPYFPRSCLLFFLNGIVRLFVSVPLWGYQGRRVPLFLVLEVRQFAYEQVKKVRTQRQLCGFWASEEAPLIVCLFVCLCFVFLRLSQGVSPSRRVPDSTSQEQQRGKAKVSSLPEGILESRPWGTEVGGIQSHHPWQGGVQSHREPPCLTRLLGT